MAQVEGIALATRLIRWFTFNVSFALIPLVCALFLRHMINGLTWQDVADSPEILFFALIISSTALGDISDMRKQVGNDLKFQIFWSALLLGAIFSAILYGSFLYDKLAAHQSRAFRDNLMKVSILLSASLLACSTLVESLIGRIHKG